MTSMIDIMNHVTTDHLSLRVNDSFWQCLMDVFGEKIPEQPHTYNTQTKVHILQVGHYFSLCMEYQVNLVLYYFVFFFIILFDYIIIFFASC